MSRRHIEVLLALERRVLRDGTLEVGPRVLVLEPLDSTLFDVLELPHGSVGWVDPLHKEVLRSVLEQVLQDVCGLCNWLKTGIHSL